ncbi:hypothetical protein DAA51_14620 [Bradyrhizobium sp. WBAH10]|nr:hypothetical protein [Bradyrhizobium sp. WBAH30]MDD1545303.1 hypothetical protein [Bradyrhizobium sp. WBAH41]MDD1561402.1 hypothetical protein [Bradyrhizobium sp. WBAH23]MDD1565932.1 hypothetical protein [Bradyrhizobium sp. WBAH33]MDD1591510.1 hypothetical protein [Bradyrhizobium sp. WBAH42]NRB89605.1 hypothetical protein [Bradyrhizobium sp. WBAH10]QCJ89665.1 hypothetical protein DAA57_15030 [Bradyrhizobium yuanmingense]
MRELNAISSHFPVQFSSAIIFIELPDSLVSTGEALRHLIPEPPVFGLWGGLILRCGLNKDMSGELSFVKNDGGAGSVQNAPDVPLAKDIDKLNIYINDEGNCIIAESGGGAMFVSDGRSNWMVSKQYVPTYCSNDVCVMLSWSANGFSQFTLDMLNRLEGKGPREENYRFGQIFDFLDRR